MIKGIIFDMDGVLVDAKEWHYQAFNDALALNGYIISHDDHLKYYDGLPTKKKLEILTELKGLPRTLYSEINKKKQMITMELILANCKPYQMHIHALSTLKSLGYKLALASNSIRETVDAMMHKTKLDVYLDLTFSSSDVLKPKPDPEIYFTTITSLGLKPEECLILEDNENGIKAAIASGAHVLNIQDIHDVNLDNIFFAIKKAEAKETLEFKI